MNLINSFNLLSSLSTDDATKTARMLAPQPSGERAAMRRGNTACNFNLTDAYLVDTSNTQVYSYEAGEACEFGVTTVSYMTSPVKHSISKGVNSNTFELQTCYHLAVMRTDDEDQTAYCYENAFVKTSSTQYVDGSASFVIAGGEIALSANDVREWTNVAVNGGDSLDVPGFYYMDEGFSAGEVIFVSAFEAKANYTDFEGRYIDLCEAIENIGATDAPTPSTVFETEDKAIEKGNVACGFNSDIKNAEVYSYKAGEACPFGITTVSYITSPPSEYITSNGVSNTYVLEVSYHLAVMRDNDGTTFCFDNASLKTGSTQYRDGTASFSGTGGEHVFTSDSIIGNWTTISVNGGNSINGFYYMEDGGIEGQVVFESAYETEANFTRIQGTFIDLCQAVEDAAPTPAPSVSSGFEKNICVV